MADVCFWKSEIVISAAYCFITTEFGLLIATDIRKRATSPDLKLEVKLCRSSRHLENRYNIISPIRTKFGSLNAEWHATYSDMVKIETVSKISIWQTFVFQTGSSYILAGGSIWTKFGHSLQNSTQIVCVVWSIANGRFLTAKLKVLLRRIFLCFPNAVWASASGGLRIISDTLVGSLLMSIS